MTTRIIPFARRRPQKLSPAAEAPAKRDRREDIYCRHLDIFYFNHEFYPGSPTCPCGKRWSQA